MTGRALAVVILVLGARGAAADGVITRQGEVVAETPTRTRCTGDACATSILRTLSGLAYATASATAGAASDGDGFAGTLRVDAVAVDYPFGDARGGTLELSELASHRVARVHAAIGEVEMFTCRAPGGELRAPILGQVEVECAPGTRLGFGATLPEALWDPATGRVAARWAQLDAVVSLLGQPNAMGYLRAHLDGSLGVDAESVWHGERDARTGSDHVARAVATVRGLARSRDARWEITGRVAVAPVIAGTVAAGRDVGVTSSAALLRHVLASARCVVSIGLAVRADYWRDPAMAVGAYDSPTARRSLFAGATLEVRRGASR